MSDSSSDGEVLDRRVLLSPVVGRVVDALGGYEDREYVIGDQANGCLKDLKKLWRKDETDDERTVARLFWEMRVLPNDLVAILLQTAGKGLVEDKRAINCVDLMTAMTWPIDLAEELKELDEELDKGTDYTQLLESHLHYKAALLQPGIIQSLFGIMLAPLAKPAKGRTERDGQIINVVLHLIRNLAFIKDLPSNCLNPDQAEFSTLQSRLIHALSDSHTFDLLLTIATNADKDPLFNGWNTLVLEIFYLFLRGVQPSALAVDQAKVCMSIFTRFDTYCISLFSNPQKVYNDSSTLKIALDAKSHNQLTHAIRALEQQYPSNLIQRSPPSLVAKTGFPLHTPLFSISNKRFPANREALWI